MRLPLPLTVRNALTHLRLAPRKGFVRLIELYQSTLSPDHGPLRHLHPYGFCRHAPTCSEYGRQMIARRGVLTGSALLTRRLLSCHPWKTPDAGAVSRAVERMP